MSLSEEYLSSFTFSIFLEDVTSELQLRRRYSDHITSTPTRPAKPKSSKMSISTVESNFDCDSGNKRFSLSKFCPHFEYYLPNVELCPYDAEFEAEGDSEPKKRIKAGFYGRIVERLSATRN